MGDVRIISNHHLRMVLDRITFAPSCVDMGWEWTIETVWDTNAAARGWLVSTTFQRPDRDTGVVARGTGRKWFVAHGETVSGIVKTAYAAAKMILEHELAEAFRYRGDRIFDPHHTVDDLAQPGRESTDARRRTP